MDFEQIKNEFRMADVDRKISIYVESDKLTKEQYRELLGLFPVSEIGRLEKALK